MKLLCRTGIVVVWVSLLLAVSAAIVKVATEDHDLPLHVDLITAALSIFGTVLMVVLLAMSIALWRSFEAPGEGRW